MVKKYKVNNRDLSLDINQTDSELVVVAEQMQVTISHIHYDQTAQVLFFQANGVPCSTRIARACHNEEASVALNNNPNIFLIQDMEFQPHVLPAVSASSRVRGDVTMLKSPLAGQVSQLFVREGQTVVQGQQLLLIESMKMENEICAPAKAFIKTIFIASGSVVQPNQPLIEFGKEGEDDASTQNEYGQKAISDR